MKEKEADLCLVARTSHQFVNVLRRHGQHRPASPVLLLAFHSTVVPQVKYYCRGKYQVVSKYFKSSK